MSSAGDPLLGGSDGAFPAPVQLNRFGGDQHAQRDRLRSMSVDSQTTGTPPLSPFQLLQSANATYSGRPSELSELIVDSGEAEISEASIHQQEEQRARHENERNRVLFLAFAILFVRYVVATFLSAFFPQVCKAQGISGTSVGIIFAAYPLGMAITSIISPLYILRYGARSSVALGLVLCAASTALFGLIPTLVPNSDVELLRAWYASVYFANGLLGGLADTGVMIIVSAKFMDKLGIIFASIGTVCGVGCMLGPLVGASLYSIDSSPIWKFRLPFFLTSIFPLALAAACYYVISGEKENVTGQPTENKDNENACSGSCKVLMNPAVTLSVVAIALSGTIVATLDPTLAYRLSTVGNASTFPAWVDGHPSPFNYSEASVALFFTCSSITYVITSIPVGWLVDRHPNSPRVFKGIQLVGFLLLAISFALLGPIRLPETLGGYGIEYALNNPVCAIVALIIKGLGSSTNNAAYPDMVIGISDNDAGLQAIMSGLWNAAYSIGWAAGPFVGGALYDMYEFDGFATIVTGVSAGYALCLLLAILPCCPDTRVGIVHIVSSS